MSEDFDKEEFLKNIHIIPSWVKNGDDLLKFCRHIQYRLYQEQAVNRWYSRNCKLTEEQHMDMLDILCAYDRAYHNDKSEFRPFSEMFDR